MNDICCIFCHLKLDNIFIRCHECTQAYPYICLDCFSNGIQTETHKNSHNYNVINTKQIKTFDNWSVYDELELTSNLETNKNLCFKDDDDWVKHTERWVDLFHGNWHHGSKVYEDRTKLTSIHLKNNQNPMFNKPSTLSLIRPGVESKQFRSMSGYRPGRGDFETEYNDKFELKYISDLDFEDETDFDLKLSLLKCYNDLLRERNERKNFVRSFGMIGDSIEFGISKPQRPVQFDIKKLEKNFDNFYNLKPVQKGFQIPQRLHRLFPSYESFIEFAELMNYQSYLKQKLDDLVEYRSSGIRKFRNISIYKNLKYKRLNKVSSCHMASLLTSVNSVKMTKSLCLDWFKKFVISEKNDKRNFLSTGRQITNSPSSYPASHMKYKNNPLKIENYPDSDKLDEEEKEFCRVARVQPTIYLRVKAILVMENSKSGFCTYSKARKIAGIDVNKTRLIHNLLLKLELIKATAPSDIENKIET